jgi:replicative superfamily II helicase
MLVLNAVLFCVQDGPVLLFCHSRAFTEQMVEYYARKLQQMQDEAGPSTKKKKVS